VPDHVYKIIESTGESDNDKIQAFADELDKIIWKNYKLWPSNYIAYDLYSNSKRYQSKYDEKELRHFERRLEVRVNLENKMEVDSFLLMYANPVIQVERL